MERLIFSSTYSRGEIMTIVTVGIDLAKNVFAVHGVDEAGKPALVRPEVPRAKLLELIANLPPCLIGMEACSGAHHWCREFAKYGHTVRMMAPKFVAPYRMSGKRGKNDSADEVQTLRAPTGLHYRTGRGCFHCPSSKRAAMQHSNIFREPPSCLQRDLRIWWQALLRANAHGPGPHPSTSSYACRLGTTSGTNLRHCDLCAAVLRCRGITGLS